jgi:hypothetical protein
VLLCFWRSLYRCVCHCSLLISAYLSVKSFWFFSSIIETILKLRISIQYDNNKRCSLIPLPSFDTECGIRSGSQLNEGFQKYIELLNEHMTGDSLPISSMFINHHIINITCIFFRMGWDWIQLVYRPLISLLYLPRMMISMEQLLEWELVGELKDSEKTCSISTLSTKNPTWSDLGSNLGLRSGKPVV